MKVNKYILREIIRYYEMKEKGHNVLAGILRSSAFPDIDLAELERAIANGTLEIEEGA